MRRYEVHKEILELVNHDPITYMYYNMAINNAEVPYENFLKSVVLAQAKKVKELEELIVHINTVNRNNHLNSVFR